MTLSRTNLITGAAFLIIIIMMATMVSLAISGMHEIQQKLDQVVSVNAEKLRQIAIMRQSNRERIIGLQYMLILDDPFEIDEIAMQHMGHANHFIAARKKLYEMASSKAETDALERIRVASMLAAPINDNIRDLVLDEEQTQAKVLMIEKLSPAQDRIYAEFTDLAEIYENQAELSNGTARQQYDLVFSRIIAILIVVTGFCAVIAYTIIQHISRKERALMEHTDQLENLVTERTAELSQEVGERVRAETIARQEGKRLAVTLASIGDGVITIRPDSTIEYMNRAAEQLTQLIYEQVVGQPVDSLLHLVDRNSGDEKSVGPMSPDIPSRMRTSGDGVLILSNGEQIDIQQTVADITDEEGITHGSVIVLRDISEARALAQRLTHQATHDPLTGLVNRREFESRVNIALNRASSDNITHTLGYIDLDKFKVINDSCGHTTGDRLLRELSERVKSRLRKGDTFARLGGDEFGLLLDQCSIKKGLEIAQTVKQTISDYRLLHNDQVYSVGASIGLVEVSAEIHDLATLLSDADAACYMAKERGRNCVQIYQSTDQDIIQRQGETRWAHIIRKALNTSAFELHCQPIASVQEHKEQICHHEVLIRLRNDDNKLVFPGSFMPAAEHFGLLTAIDSWVITESFEWIGLNPDAIGNGRLSINIAGASLSDPSFLPFVIDSFSSSGANPGQIIIEITENVAISNLKVAIEFMTTLGELGCEFALDDFGRGFSSLGSLKDLPVDYLKIDGGFIKNILNDPADQATVNAINEIGHALGKKTVAEHVENDDICKHLTDMGVDFVQGFSVARPKHIDEVFGTGKTDNLYHCVPVA